MNDRQSPGDTRQQEYIITNEQLVLLKDSALSLNIKVWNNIVDAIRSRPTPAPAPGDTRQQEYIITEMQLKRILVLMNRDTVMDEEEFLDIAAELRFRPAASQPTEKLQPLGCTCNKYSTCKECFEHDAAIRNEVLGKLQELVASLCPSEGIHKGWVLAYPLDKWIADKKKSLRSTGTTADKGGE